MTPGVAALVLLAALLHAAWNAIAKAIPHRLASATLIALVFLVAGIAGAAVYGLPDRAAWPFIVASALLQSLYLLMLTASYKYGDFSQVYPLARGLAVLLVALVSVAFLGEHLSPLQLTGVLVVGGSLLALALTGGDRHRKATLFAVATGVCIAAYSVADGTGVRESGSPFAYIAWLFLIHGAITPVICWIVAKDRRMYVSALGRHWKLGILGGVLSMLAYGIVVWAQNLAPLALVSALRESSVLLAGVIGFLVFGERFSRVRMAWTTAAVAGIVVLQLG